MSGALAAADPTLSDFNQQIWWLVLLKVGIVFVFLLLTTIFMIWFERRVIGRMQNRPGPNRAGPWGLLQPIADALKLPLKEDVTPTGVDKLVFFVAPILACAPAFVAFAIIPWGPEVSIFHHQTPLQVTDLPVAVLLVLAMSSVGVYGIVLAGWASRGPYSILGALRSTAQVISYEIAMALSFVAVFLDAGSLSTSQIVAAQQHYWYFWVLFPSFLIYLVTMVGETNRIPFDLPEGEGEIVAGHMTEYSSMKFAMFFLAEYINMTTVSALATTLFLGGWRAPVPISTFWPSANSGWWPVLWFLIKVFFLLFCYVWLRGTLPRTRYDQLMALGWKILIPFSIVWLLLVATVRALREDNHSPVVYAVAGDRPRALHRADHLLGQRLHQVARAAGAGQAGCRAKKKTSGTTTIRASWSRWPSPLVPEPRYPVPPLDLPHYHGLELGDTALTGSTYGDADDATKEVTGA